MIKSRKRRPTPEEKVETLINKMFEIAGYNVAYNDIKDRKDAWYTDWTMTVEQNKEWVDWMVNYFKKECKTPAKLAEREAAMCSLMWGLKFSDL